MERLLGLLKDGNARSVEALAMELGTSTDDVRRQMEYLERFGIIRRVSMHTGGCGSCGGCGGINGAGGKGTAACAGCLPEGGFQHMGEMWEVVLT